MQRRRNTTFVTLPIVALAASAFGVVLASLAIGAREVDSLAIERQRATIEQAIDQFGLSLARELRVQSVWNEGYEKVHAEDLPWLHKYYGTYLNQLLGYDRIYVLSSDDKPIYGFDAQTPGVPSDYAKIAPSLSDLVEAIRVPNPKLPADNVLNKEISLGQGYKVHHRAVTDVRAIDGHPMAVVISTIVPDHAPPDEIEPRPYLLVAIEDLDKSFTQQLGTNFGFRDLQWISGDVPTGYDTEVVRATNDGIVGKLAWRKERPGLDFMLRAAPGLMLALLPIALLTYLLIVWGKRQLKRILESEQDATRAARTDALTDLPNRVALRERLGLMLDEARSKSSTVAVVSVDLNHFKGINDAFGHAIGDSVLKACARRLEGLVGDDCLVVRPDGDSFAVLAPGLGNAAVSRLANMVIEELTEPFDVGGTRVFVSASVGYSLGLRDGDTGDELMRRAELALGKAKEEADSIAIAFAPDMDAEVTYRLMLETALRAAVADEAIEVVYQPLMDASGERVLAVEALARWTDPDFGAISPEIFIPLAEETGLIQAIGELVLRRAVNDCKAWPDVSVAVNVSASQIHHGDVVDVVRKALAESRTPAHKLEIEITESVLLTDEKRANEQMRGLQGLGVRVALDDFGTGYSSLQYLRRFGFDKLKIDRSFIDGAGDPMGSSVVLASIIKLGQDLDLTITAEGVETEEQRRWLQAAGCHQLQGFLFSRPLTAAEMIAFIASHQTNRAVAS